MRAASIFDYLDEHLRRDADAIVYLHGDRAISFREIDRMGAQCRGALHALGVRAGDRVALVMHDCPEMIAMLLGVMGIGAVAVPCCTMLTASELAYLLEDSGSCCAVVSADQVAGIEAIRNRLPALASVLVMGGGAPAGCIDFHSALERAPWSERAEITAETPAFIIYSSGSTGAPKGAVHRHGDIPHTIELSGRPIYEIGPNHRLFSAPRLFFGYGFTNSFSFPLGLGAVCVLTSERPTAPVVASILRDYRPSILFGVPATFRGLLDHHAQEGGLDTASLKFSISAGEKLSAPLFRKWKSETGTDILDFLGTTELLYAFIANRKDSIRPGSSGTPVPGYHVRLMGDDGRVIEGAGTGALQVKGPSAITHYWNKPERTAETIRDGYVRTGDLYRRDADGSYYFEGRTDDVFKSSGLWVSPGEIEDILCGHPAVRDAAVVSEPGPEGDLAIVAFVVLHPGEVSRERVAADLTAGAAQALPRYKRPSVFRFLAQLPRTPTGKIQRHKLRALSTIPDFDLPIAV